MLILALITSSLLATPVMSRAQVPLAHPNLKVVAIPLVFNPVAKARASETTVTVTPQVAGTLDLAVVDRRGTLVTQLTTVALVAAGSSLTAEWAGKQVPDGEYAIRARLTEENGVIDETVALVTVDSTAPKLRLSGPSLPSKAPIQFDIRTTDPSGLAGVRLSISSQSGRFLGTVKVPRSKDRLSAQIDWNTRLRGKWLLPGAYLVSAHASDAVGNVGTSAPQVFRVGRAVSNTIIYSLRETDHRVALTFDDCADGQAWDRIISAFKAAKAKTSFFCNGVNVRSNPKQARRAVREGHTIGAHTWAHPVMPKLSAAAQYDQIDGDIGIWWQVAKASPLGFYRPPYGEYNAVTIAQASRLGFAHTVMWDVDPSDYLNPPAAQLIAHILTKSRNGSIAVMHVNANTAAAVPAIIRGLRQQGLEPSSLEQMLGDAASLSRRAPG